MGRVRRGFDETRQDSHRQNHIIAQSQDLAARLEKLGSQSPFAGHLRTMASISRCRFRYGDYKPIHTVIIDDDCSVFGHSESSVF